MFQVSDILPPTFVGQTLFFIKHIPTSMQKVGLIWDQPEIWPGRVDPRPS